MFLNISTQRGGRGYSEMFVSVNVPCVTLCSCSRIRSCAWSSLSTGRSCSWLCRLWPPRRTTSNADWTTTGWPVSVALSDDGTVPTALHPDYINVCVFTSGWLDDIGLPQYKSHFDEARVDGCMLHYMTVVSWWITREIYDFLIIQSFWMCSCMTWIVRVEVDKRLNSVKVQHNVNSTTYGLFPLFKSSFDVLKGNNIKVGLKG